MMVSIKKNIKYVQLGHIDLDFKVKKSRVSVTNFPCMSSPSADINASYDEAM